jgi:hypothetical protein
VPADWSAASKTFLVGSSLFATLTGNLAILAAIDYAEISLAARTLVGDEGEAPENRGDEARRGIVALSLLEDAYRYMLTLLADRWARREVGVTPHMHADAAQVALLLAASYSAINDTRSTKLNTERAQCHFADYIGSRENREGYYAEGGWVPRPDKLRSEQERSAFNECLRRIK